MAFCGYLRQSTAVDILLGPCLDDTDGKTAETALTLTQPDVQLSKNGAAQAQKSAAQTLTHDAGGCYPANLSTTDTNTLGLLTVRVHESGALPIRQDYQVIKAGEYDFLYATAGQCLPRGILDFGTVGAAATSTTGCDLRSAATFTSTHLVGGIIQFDDGQSRQVLTQTTDSITFDALTTAPTASTTTYVVWASAPASTGAPVPANVTQLSGDATAADNAEAFFDGTGYAGTNNVIPTVTSVTSLAGSAGIKKNTAKAAFPFLMTDSTTHAPATGLTITATRSLDGAAFGACANSASEVANGVYKISLAAADLNGDTVTLKFTAAGADQTTIVVVTGP